MVSTTATGSGLWSTVANWNAGVPTSAVDAIIASGVALTTNGSMTCNTLQITGSLDFSNQDLLVVSGTTIKPGGLLSGSTGELSLGSTMNGGTGSGGGPWISYGLKVQEGTFYGGSANHTIGAINVTNNANSKCYLTSGTTLLNGNGTSNSSNGQIVYVGTLSVLSSPVDSIVEINPGAGANPWTETQIEIRNDPLSNLYINCPTGTVNNYIGDGSAILNIGQEFHIVSGTFECNKGANANQGKLRVTGNTFISSSATVDLNDSDLCHFYANVDNDGTLTATSDVMTIEGDFTGAGSFVHNNGTMKMGGYLFAPAGYYNLISFGTTAPNWRNEAIPYQYISHNDITIENDFTISGTYVRSERDVTVGGNMVVGIEGGGTESSGSGFCADTSAIKTLTVSGNLEVWEDAYVGNSGYDYDGARGTGYIGSSNKRRGTIIVEGYVGVWGDMAANSGSSAGNANYWDFGCLHIGDGVVYAPQASGTWGEISGDDEWVESPILVGAYGSKGRDNAGDVFNNIGTGRFYHNSGTVKNHNANQRTDVRGADSDNGPFWNYSLKAVNLGNGHFVYDAGPDWLVENDLTVDSALFYPLGNGIVGGNVLCQDSTGGGVTFCDNAYEITVSGNFTMNKGAGLARFRNPTLHLYGNFINNGGTWY